jgi:formiminotetrahydrofolate cyclodeaminase
VIDALARDRSDPDRARAVNAALSDAADPPLKIATAAAEVAELAAAAADATGNEHLLGDATAAAAIAEAATQAAARLVALNLVRVPDDLRLKQARELVERAGEARAATVQLRA